MVFLVKWGGEQCREKEQVTEPERLKLTGPKRVGLTVWRQDDVEGSGRP
jgi:hypothetical protein